MELFPALAIVVMVILLVILIGLGIFFVITNNKTTSNNNCDSQTQCSWGYVCTYPNNQGQGVCKGGVQTTCNTSDDCAFNLTCSNNICIKPLTNRVIVNLPEIETIKIEPRTLSSDSSEASLEEPISNVSLEEPTPKLTLEEPTLKILPLLTLPPIINKIPLKSALSVSDNTDNVTDAPFDIHSDSSNLSKDLTPPYEIKDEVYYSYSPIIDICTYSDETLFLLDNGNIICDKNTVRRKIINNVILERILTFNGYIHGLGFDKKLYSLSNDYYCKKSWIWTLVRWAPDNISWISSTYDSSYLWLQIMNKGILYDISGSVKETKTYDNSNIRRIYGKDIIHYVEIDKMNKTLINYFTNEILDNIFDAVLSYNDKIFVVRDDEEHLYKSIRIVNWKPYYIRK